MKKIIILAMFIPFSFLGCTKDDAGIRTNDTEQVLENLKEKYGIDYQRVDAINDSSTFIPLTELQAFFDDFECQSSQVKSRIAEPELYDAHSIEGTARVREYFQQYEIMGTYNISKYTISFRYLITQTQNSPIITVEYIKLDQDLLGISDKFVGINPQNNYLYYANAGARILTSDSQGVAYRVNWGFHISGSFPIDLDVRRPQIVMVYLSTEEYSEVKI